MAQSVDVLPIVFFEQVHRNEQHAEKDEHRVPDALARKVRRLPHEYEIVDEIRGQLVVLLRA